MNGSNVNHHTEFRHATSRCWTRSIDGFRIGDDSTCCLCCFFLSVCEIFCVYNCYSYCTKADICFVLFLYLGVSNNIIYPCTGCQSVCKTVEAWASGSCKEPLSPILPRWPRQPISTGCKRLDIRYGWIKLCLIPGLIVLSCMTLPCIYFQNITERVLINEAYWVTETREVFSVPSCPLD